MKPALQLDPYEQARTRLLEARRFAAHAQRFLDDAERQFISRDLIPALLLQASDNAQKTVAAIDDVKKLLGARSIS